MSLDTSDLKNSQATKEYLDKIGVVKQAVTEGSKDIKTDLNERFDLLETAAYVTTAGIMTRSLATSEGGMEFLNSLPGANVIADQFNRSPIGASISIQRQNQNFGRAITSQVMALEEASPLHLLRTFQLTNLMQPFMTHTDFNESVLITGNQLRNQQFFYEKLLEFSYKEADRKVGRQLKAEDLKRGVMFMNNTLYGVDVNGNIDKNDVLLKDARLVLANQKNGNIVSQNQVLRKYAEIVGGKINFEAAKADPVMVMGSNSASRTMVRQANSYFRYGMEIGFKTMDNPLGGVEELFRGAGAEHTGLFDSKFYKKAKSLLNIQLGTNGVYNMSMTDSIRVMSGNVAKKSLMAYIGYQVADSTVRMMSLDGSAFSNGLFAGISNLYADARIKFAQLWSDRFQGYKNSQEAAAEGSTNLTSLMGLPLIGALAGAQMAYAQRVNHTIKEGAESAAAKFTAEVPDEFLSKLGLNKPLTIMRRRALKGGLMGAALAVPFLPGALIGTSSAELKEIYSGRKEVEVKANRGWLFGGGHVDGGHTRYFKKSWVKEATTEAHTKTIYGSAAEKKDLSPFLKPFAYLRDPYRFEKKNDERMPYPVWGMDVSFGGPLGKIFERTIGQIIKPDRINPRYEEARRKAGPNNQVGSTGGTRASGDGTTPFYTNNVFKAKKEERYNTKSLIKDGLMEEQQTATLTPIRQGIIGTYNNLTDFTGIKGFGFSLVAEAIVGKPKEQIQLSRSGEANNSARRLKEESLGDMAGLGEFQRRLVGTSADSIPKTQNLMYNTMARWLPSDASKYFNDFSVGNPYQTVDKGATRLPGKGYSALNPDLKNTTDFERYPLIYQYKVLADVAKGSEEHIKARRQLLDLYTQNKLSRPEIDILVNTLDQEVARDNRKNFHQQGSSYNPIHNAQSGLWGIIRKLESPLEMLTPWRPSAKFMHQRTAIEDYQQTQLGGTDSAIWTNPYSHFIKPAFNKIMNLGPANIKPKEKLEKDTINEYFDKLGAIKAVVNANEAKFNKTVVTSSLSGLTTKDSILRFKGSLSDEEKDYFQAFSTETDKKKRSEILSMLPTDVARGYEQIWKNLDIAQEAKRKGHSVQKALADRYIKDTENLMKSVGSKISISAADMEAIELKVRSNQDDYAMLNFSVRQRIELERANKARQKIALSEADSYVRQATGIPSANFAGWDPRLSIDDIKIKTLSLGKEDLRRFGFWQGDENRMNRINAFEHENDVVHSLDKIKQRLQHQDMAKTEINKIMFKNGFKASRVKLNESDMSSLYIYNEDKVEY